LEGVTLHDPAAIGTRDRVPRWRPCVRT
jgi:hypothetical protein